MPVYKPHEYLTEILSIWVPRESIYYNRSNGNGPNDNLTKDQAGNFENTDIIDQLIDSRLSLHREMCWVAYWTVSRITQNRR